MNAVCMEEYDQDGLIDSLLAPCKGWPQYMMPNVVRSNDASSSLPGKAVPALESKAGSNGHDRQQEEDHKEFRTDFALALGADLGFGLLLQPARGIPRSVYLAKGSSAYYLSKPQFNSDVAVEAGFVSLFCLSLSSKVSSK